MTITLQHKTKTKLNNRQIKHKKYLFKRNYLKLSTTKQQNKIHRKDTTNRYKLDNFAVHFITKPLNRSGPQAFIHFDSRKDGNMLHDTVIR